MVKEYKTITQVAGPLIFVEKTEPVGYGEFVNIRLADGTIKRGEVLDTSEDIVVVQVYEGTGGLNKDCAVTFTGDSLKLPASIDLLGRIPVRFRPTQRRRSANHSGKDDGYLRRCDESVFPRTAARVHSNRYFYH